MIFLSYLYLHHVKQRKQIVDKKQTYTVLLADGTSELIEGNSKDHALDTNGYFHSRHYVSMIVEGSVQHEYEWNNVVKVWEQKLEYRDEL